MNDPAHTDPGSFASRLALDAVVPLYRFLHVPPDDGSFAMNKFLKEAMEYSQFTPSWSPILWEKVVSYADSTLEKDTNEHWIGWIFNAFTGSHPPDVDLSGWLMAIDYYGLPHANWDDTGMRPNEMLLVKHFIDAYITELDEPAFMAAADEARSRPLTDWDKRMHQVHEIVYFDDLGCKDPFLELKFANQGEALRRILASYDFPPDFPHQPFLGAAQLLLDSRNVWMPEGRKLSPLTEVR